MTDQNRRPYTWADRAAKLISGAGDRYADRVDAALSDPLPVTGALSAVLPSPLGDALGIAADAVGYARNPATATPANVGMSLLGALPFFPAGVVKLAPALKLKDGRVIPGTFGGMHFQILGDLQKHGAREADILDDGFVDATGKYLTRREAMSAAKRADSTIETLEPHRLYSEDLISHHALDFPDYE